MIWTISILAIATYMYSKYFHFRSVLQTNSLKDSLNVLFGFMSIGMLMYLQGMFPLNHIFFGEVHHYHFLGEISTEVKPTIMSYLCFDYLQIALPEELVKYTALGVSLYLCPAKDRTESIYRGACVGLGFAALENFQYVNDLGAPMFVRLMAPTMFHASLGVIMGYYMYNLKQEDFYKGLLACVFLHGSYDFVLMVGLESQLALFLSIFFLVMAILTGEKLIKKSVQKYIN